MRKLLCFGILCVMCLFVSCSDSNSKEFSGVDDKTTSFLDVVDERAYLEDDRKAINLLCETYRVESQGKLSKEEYNRLERKFSKDLDGYDTRLALVTKYESFLYGYLRNFNEGTIDKVGIDEIYQQTKEELLKTETKKEFYDVCVAFEKDLKKDFRVDIMPSTDIRLYMEERNRNGTSIFGDDAESVVISDENVAWPVGGAYVDYDGRTYETREDVETAVNAGVTEGYYYLYEDGTVDSPVPISDTILNNYKRKHR